MLNNTDKIADMCEELAQMSSVKFYNDSFPGTIIKDEYGFFSFSERASWLAQTLLDAAIECKAKTWLIVASLGDDVFRYHIDIRNFSVTILKQETRNLVTC